jgi:hypothetical protein
MCLIRRFSDQAGLTGASSFKFRLWGDATDYYEKLRTVIELVRPVWTRHLDGAIDVEAALGEMASGLER